MRWLGRILRKFVKWTLILFGGLTVLAIVLSIFFGENLTDEERAARDAERVETKIQKDAENVEREAERAAEKAIKDAENVEREAERAAEKAIKDAENVEREAKRAAERAEADANKEAKRLKELEDELLAEAEENRKGFHCLSGWDGSHANFKREVESMMRDPDSFEHISTRVTPVSAGGMHTVLMEYRARNGFGGMNVGTASGTFRNSDCSHTVISVE